MSLATSGSYQPLDQAQKAFIYANISWVSELDLEDSQEFQAKDLSCDRYQFFELAKVGAFTKVRNFSNGPAIWRVPQGWEAAVEEAVARSNLLPCGHRGFRNPRGVDGYTCVEECGRVYTRAEIKEEV